MKQTAAISKALPHGGASKASLLLVELDGRGVGTLWTSCWLAPAMIATSWDELQRLMGGLGEKG